MSASAVAKVVKGDGFARKVILSHSLFAGPAVFLVSRSCAVCSPWENVPAILSLRSFPLNFALMLGSWI